ALEECHALSVARWQRLLAAEAENERLRKELAAAAKQPESRAITALKVTLFGVECYLPASIAEAVQERCDESALEQREGWRPIETAPRDGTRILLGYAGIHSEEGYWMADANRNHWGETGWFASDEDVLCKHPSHPDAWMPLPTPPNPEGSGSPEVKS